MITKKIAILISGTGTNAVNLIKYFSKSPVAKIQLIISNKKSSPALKKADDLDFDELIHIHKNCILLKEV